MKVEALKKPCVKFKASRLNILRENQICKKVNQNINQERTARPPGQPYFNNQIFYFETWLKNDEIFKDLMQTVG